MALDNNSFNRIINEMNELPGGNRKFNVLHWEEEAGKPILVTVLAHPADPNSVIRGVAENEGLEEGEYEYKIIDHGPGYVVSQDQIGRIAIDVWQDHKKLMSSLRAKYKNR